MKKLAKQFSSSYFLLLWLISTSVFGQITSGCYTFSIHGIELDYNPAIDSIYLYGRPAATGTKTNIFRVENAPSPNATNFTIKTSDEKYITRNAKNNKMSVSADFSDPANQVFQIVMNGNNINIFLVGSQFGLSPMQWSNNTQAYILSNTSSWVVQPTATTCVSVVSAPTPNPTPSPTTPTTTNSVGWTNSGTNNIINTNSGGVIIGTGITATPPGYSLYVAFGILTESITVAVKNSIAWADDVFEVGYPLPSLEAVKRYIEINKHLSGIPTTKEILKTGVNLGRIVCDLLRKVEELTVYAIQEHDYAIQEHKRLNLLSAQIAFQRKDQQILNQRLIKLENKISKLENQKK